MLVDLEQYAFVNGKLVCLYSDSVYPLCVYLQVPYTNCQLTQEMENFNKSVSAVIVLVEWIFGDIVNYFRFLDFKKNLKIGLCSIGKMYIVAAILRNAPTCLQSKFELYLSWSLPGNNFR